MGCVYNPEYEKDPDNSFIAVGNSPNELVPEPPRYDKPLLKPESTEKIEVINSSISAPQTHSPKPNKLPPLSSSALNKIQKLDFENDLKSLQCLALSTANGSDTTRSNVTLSAGALANNASQGAAKSLRTESTNADDATVVQQRSSNKTQTKHSLQGLIESVRQLLKLKPQEISPKNLSTPKTSCAMADNFEEYAKSEGGTDAVAVNKVKVTSKDVNLIKKKVELLSVTKGILQSSLDGKMSSKIDVVVVYTPSKHDKQDKSDEEKQEDEEKEKLREKFRTTCKNEGFELSEEVADVPPLGSKAFIKLHCQFDTMCEYAERLKIGMPLADCEVLGDEYYYEGFSGRIRLAFHRSFGTEDDPDSVKAPFDREKAQQFEGYPYQDIFFRSSTRSLLTEHILENMDARNEDEIKESEKLQNWNLSWFIHKGVLDDFFFLHEESTEDPLDPKANNYIKKEIENLRRTRAGLAPLDANGVGNEGVSGSQREQSGKSSSEPFYYDARKDLHYRWSKPKFKMLPLLRIRNYFGEKIALYFAWVETLIVSLIFPVIVGLVVFTYGLVQSGLDFHEAFNSNTNSTEEGTLVYLAAFNKCVDNELTSGYCLFICLWATLFLEVWKRRNATLKYEWGVNEFEEIEPDRPQFVGVTEAHDPFTGELVRVFPFAKKVPRIIASTITVLVMIIIVIAATLAVIIYRAFSANRYETSALRSLLLSTLLAAVMNALAILILEKVYRKLAYILTDWENHRTQTEYDDALVLKTFVFYFVNSYASLFYIAFLRGSSNKKGIFGFGSRFTDECANGDCMSELGLQTLILMIAKPVPKFLMDNILPWARAKAIAIWVKISRRQTVAPDGKAGMYDNMMIREYLKPDLDDFTLEEYTEKAIQFGFQVIFAPSIPLGPLVMLIFLLLDIRIDPRRMLWVYRRPLATRAADIGTWETILEFLTYIAVIVNAAVISFTSSFGREGSRERQLVIFILFEHIVFVIKFILAYLIPDIPDHIRLAQRKEYFEAQKRLNDSKKGDKGKPKYRPLEEVAGGVPYNQIYRNRKKREKRHRQNEPNTSAST